jgi:LPXTG-motif cell wall-anchored protein
MTWLKAAFGAILALVGLVWLGQGLNLIQGSPMTGQSQWAIIGVVLLAIAGWLLWSVRSRRRLEP